MLQLCVVRDGPALSMRPLICRAVYQRRLILRVSMISSFSVEEGTIVGLQGTDFLGC